MWKLAVVAVAYKVAEQGVRILTQLRNVQNPDYDPLFDQTWEAMGETVKEGENIVTALKRGCQEEWGIEDLQILNPQSIESYTMTTGQSDTSLCCQPRCFLQSLGPPQPWVGPVFFVKVPPDFEPNFDRGDQEATEARWWTYEDLSSAISDSPQDFMGWHLPALREICRDAERGLLV
jgi:isopentenyldiphosphate isomerase